MLILHNFLLLFLVVFTLLIVYFELDHFVQFEFSYMNVIKVMHYLYLIVFFFYYFSTPKDAYGDELSAS